MASVNVQETVEASAERVWEIFADFGGLSKWADPDLIASCESDGNEVGAVRTIILTGGGEIRERLDILEPETRRFSYSILGECPLPVKNYLATVKVTSQGEGVCTVDWQSTFEPVGPQEQAESVVRGVYTGGVAGIRKTLEV